MSDSSCPSCWTFASVRVRGPNHPQEADIARKVLGQMVAEDPTVTVRAKRQAAAPASPQSKNSLASIKEQ